MRSIPAPPERLEDSEIALRLAAERDIPETLIAYQDDPQMHHRLGETRPPSGAELGRRMEQAAADMDQGLGVRLTIIEAGNDDCRGQVIGHGFDWDNHRAEIGVWVAPQLRNRGVARRALNLAAPWLFAACGLKRIALLTEPENEPMLRAARAAGFAEEGVLRGYRRGRGGRGGRVDMAVLSRISSDAAEASGR
jgi:RimJ/RimL family protein N-acetyltransferase